MFGKVYKAPKINYKPVNQRTKTPVKTSVSAPSLAPKLPTKPVVSTPPPISPNKGAQNLINVPPPPPPPAKSISKLPGKGSLSAPPPPPPVKAGQLSLQSRPKLERYQQELDKLAKTHKELRTEIGDLQRQLQVAYPTQKGKLNARLHALQDVESKLGRVRNELQTEKDNLHKLPNHEQSMKKGEIRNVANTANALPGKFNQSVDQWYNQIKTAQQQQNPNGVSKNKLYLGRFDDLKRHAGWEKNGSDWSDTNVKGYKEARRLNATDWNLGVNEAFIQGGIDEKARFKFKTNFTPEAQNLLKQNNLTGTSFLQQLEPQKGKSPVDPNLWDTKNSRPTVTAREIAQLLDSGYKYNESPRNQVKHPGENKAQMLPK